MKRKNKLIYLEEKDRAKEELKQCVKAYEMKVKEYKKLYEENKKLQNNLKKAIEFGNGLLIGEATFEERHIANRFLNILKGDSDEK